MGLQVTGNRELAALLEQQAARMRDPEPALAVAAARLTEVLAETADAERAPDGSAWAPRERASRRRDGRRAYARRDVRGSLLRRSGRMLGALVAAARSGAVVVADAVPYLVFHQNGTRDVPARRVIPTASMVAGPIGEWISETARRVERYVTAGRV